MIVRRTAACLLIKSLFICASSQNQITLPKFLADMRPFIPRSGDQFPIGLKVQGPVPSTLIQFVVPHETLSGKDQNMERDFSLRSSYQVENNASKK
jgi:hypothetical protein